MSEWTILIEGNDSHGQDVPEGEDKIVEETAKSLVEEAKLAGLTVNRAILTGGAILGGSIDLLQ